MRDSSLDDEFDGGLPPRPDPAVPATAAIDAHGIITGWSSEAERLLGRAPTYTVEQVVGELVTNALRYGTPPAGLRVIHNSDAPHLRRTRALDEGGRGLLLVARVTGRWGTRHLQRGKTIRAEAALADD